MEQTLRQILALSRLGPAVREPIQIALASRDPERLRLAGRVVVRALLQRGDLVRVMIQGEESGNDHIYALRGHAALLDLDPFMAVGPRQERGRRIPSEAPTIEPPPESERSGPPWADPDREQERLLHAMETAQQLQMSHSIFGDDFAWLDPVLGMLNAQLSDTILLAETMQESISPTSHIQVMDPEHRPFWARSRTSGETVWIGDAAELPPAVRRLVTASGISEIVQALAMPLIAPQAERSDDQDGEQEEVGLLYVVSRHSKSRAEFLRLGSRLSRFVTHSWQQRLQMNRLVHTDSLTGVRNRGYFDAQFPLELERCKRQSTPLILLIGDLDHFKHVNDTHGHPMGDQVLRTVAQELLDGLRRIDLVCRVGGEEFVLILPDTSIEAAQDVVTRLQVSIANLRFNPTVGSDPVRVTASFGGVAFPEGGDDPQELYRLADDMLYLSKERGRNRCHFWQPNGEPILTLPQYRTD